MPDRGDQVFELVRKFKQLDLVEHLDLIPQSELVVMKAILKITAEGDQPTVSEIAKFLYISPPAVSRTLRRLRLKRYVGSLTPESDRRSSRLTVTAEGKNALEADVQKLRAFMERALAHLEPGEFQQFYSLFTRIYDGVKQEMEKEESGRASETQTERDDRPNA